MKTLIISGNYIETSYFAVNGCMAVKIGFDKSKKGDETKVVFEDGLYKAYKNDLLKMAATDDGIEEMFNSLDFGYDFDCELFFNYANGAVSAEHGVRYKDEQLNWY